MKENGGRRLGGEHGGIWIHAVFPALYRRCWKDVVIQAGLAYRRRCSVNEKKKNLCVLLWNITFSKMCHHEMESYKEKTSCSIFRKILTLLIKIQNKSKHYIAQFTNVANLIGNVLFFSFARFLTF